MEPTHIATQDFAHGGIGLFTDTSQQCKDLFGKSPSAIIVTRPDTYLRFLKLLAGKEHLLHKLAVRDLWPRSLGVETRVSILNLVDITNRMYRRVLQGILEKKCISLLYVNQQHPSVATCTTWDDRMQRTVSELLNLELTPMILPRFG